MRLICENRIQIQIQIAKAIFLNGEILTEVGK
jgi:hypothetical protein